MKFLSTVLLATTLAASSAFAKEPWELDIPGLDDQIAAAEQTKFDDLFETVKTHDEFAGNYTRLTFRGVEYNVDRRNEPKKRPGNPPSRESLSSILGNMTANTRGEIRIKVTEQFDANGVMTGRTWEIDIGGSWQASSGMSDANDKQHK